MDDDLLEGCRRGDDAAWERLVATHDDAVTRTAFAILGDAREARDAAQETWIRVFRALSRFELGSDFRAWLLTIAVREAYRRRRGPRWRMSWLPLSSAAEIAAPVADHDRALDTLATVRRLPREQATAVILRYYHDLSVPQVARAMGRPEGTVKSWLSRALVKLREGMLDGAPTDVYRKEGIHHAK